MSDDQTKILENGGDDSKRIIEMLRLLLLRSEAVETRLEELENKVEERLKDTRPLWEGVQAQLVELREGQEKLREEVQTGFRRVAQRLDVVSVDINNVRADIHDHETRITKLEDRP